MRGTGQTKPLHARYERALMRNWQSPLQKAATPLAGADCWYKSINLFRLQCGQFRSFDSGDVPTYLEDLIHVLDDLHFANIGL